MLTLEELHILTSYEAQNILLQNIDKNSAEFALSFRNSSFPIPLLATQLKYLQRAKDKLPSYYQAGAIIPGISYEQCSSEKSANCKDFSGKTCLDLTCGLGVDTYHFSKNFEKVISIERDFVLTEIAKHNFSLLKAENIEVLNISAEDFLLQYKGEVFDLIYLDPSRRDDKGGKVFLPQDCSPDLDEIMPLLFKISLKVVVKLSPLYDIAAAQKDFPSLTEIHILSIDNECKEVLLVFNSNLKDFKIEIICSRRNEVLRFNFLKNDLTLNVEKENEIKKGNFLYEPDIAFYKARQTEKLFQNYYPHHNGFLSHVSGFFFSAEELPNFPGRVFRILDIWDYQPKKIKTILKDKQLSKINIIQRNFPFSVEKIRASLSVNEGGNDFLICTTIHNQNQVFYGERVC